MSEVLKFVTSIVPAPVLRALFWPLLIGVCIWYHEDRIRKVEVSIDVTAAQRTSEIEAIKELTSEVRKYREAYIEHARQDQEWLLSQRRGVVGPAPTLAPIH